MIGKFIRTKLLPGAAYTGIGVGAGLAGLAYFAILVAGVAILVLVIMISLI